MTDVEKITAMDCRWCKVPIRTVPVIVGRPPGRLVLLKIDVDPNPGGCVIQRRSDGAFRMIAERKRPQPGRDSFRVHGARTCDADAQLRRGARR